MSVAIAWLLFSLGVAHVAYGLVKFRGPLSKALADGFVDRFRASELRRTAFWFVIFGPLLMLAGHAAIHAASGGDLGLLRVIGGYVLFISVVGVAAFPKSPFWASLIVSPLLMAAGYGWLE
jgi:hypothetical protein